MSRRDQQRRQRLAALGAKREIPTPEGEAKMSAIIVQLAEPLIKEHATTAERAEAIIAGWNKSMFSADKQPLIEEDLINCFVPRDGAAEAVGFAVEVMDRIADQREKLFPDLRKIIVDYEVDIDRGQLNLNLTSAPIPDLE